MANDLDVTLLRAFVTTIRAGSISRAATVLRHTQPGVSQQLRRLERVVGLPLLHRTPSGVSPTKAGEALLPYAERIIALSAQALASTSKALTGHCGIGILEDLAVARLPQLLADFARLHPEVTLEVMILSGPLMREAFENGRILLALGDVGYLVESPRWSVRHPLVWVTGQGVDLMADPLPLVLFSQPCRWRTSLLEALDEAGRSWRVAFESTGLAGVRAAVSAGLGVSAFLPANVDPDLTIVSSPQVLPPLPDVEIGLVRRPGTEGDPLVDAIDSALKAMI
ncbi:LysR substrate-binding domain-containing protein [Nonomuraea sp. NPDC002799]